MTNETVRWSLEDEFRKLAGLDWQASPEIRVNLEAVMVAIGHAVLSEAARKAALMRACNNKLGFYAETYRAVLDLAASHEVLFNYHQKIALKNALESGRHGAFRRALSKIPQVVGSPSLKVALERLFVPLSWPETRNLLHRKLADEPNDQAVCNALFAAYIFSCFKRQDIHQYFAYQSENCTEFEQKQLPPASAKASAGRYLPRFTDFLRAVVPQVWNRCYGLAYLRVDEALLQQELPKEAWGDLHQLRNAVLRAVRALAQKLSNHCYLCVHLKPLPELSALCGEDLSWMLSADVALYAERFQQSELKTGYFHPTKIADDTLGYVQNAKTERCRFELAYEGMHFKDCFVVFDESQVRLPADIHPDLVLLFEKNERDETVIPCPACRSWQVRGNSYPTLGVRSWECVNPLCPERSKYDRGNRYSMVSLLRQEAIEDERAQIPLQTLRSWKRDVVRVTHESAITKMAALHYTLPNDTVLVCASSDFLSTPAFVDRSMRYFPFTQHSPDTSTITGAINHKETVFTQLEPEAFEDSSFFERFRISRPDVALPNTLAEKTKKSFANLTPITKASIFCGDCFDVMRTIKPESIDGIVTSPPYYNARKYASWPNIYAYLFDQWNVIQMMWRVLKPGGVVLFNIFDYFDNDRTIVYSDMGKKRLILSSYAAHLFRRAGFRLLRNVVWDKGEIEGKRNFNGGNRSPYYQAPFNCWEHIWVFSKGEPTCDVAHLPFLLRKQPVMKMVRGSNISGHTAPFPEAIPNLLLDILPKDACILDPYAGSFTSVLAALKKDKCAIGIDYLPEYCELGCRRIRNQISEQLSLLDD